MENMTLYLLGSLFTILVYGGALKMKKLPVLGGLNSVLVSVFVIILVLYIFDINYDHYETAVRPISSALSPLVVFIAVPLYKHKALLSKNAKAVGVGIVVSAVVSTITVVSVALALGVSDELMRTLLPKSITTPMAISMSEMVGGMPGITVVSVIITGIIGASFIPFLLKFTGIDNSVAIGVCLGAASHGIGTSKAIEIGDEAGAISGLVMGLTGVFFILATSVCLMFV